MGAEYLYTHATLRSTIVKGKTTAELAGLDKAKLENVFDFVMHELVREMSQHRLHPRMIEAPIRQRCEELEQKKAGTRLGGVGSSDSGSARERTLAAAERRAREQKEKER